MRLTIAISGASGAHLGQKLLEAIPPEHETHLIVSDGAKVVLQREAAVYTDDQLWARVASGSFKVDAMAIVPCSMNTLAKIACGISDTLTTRAAAVTIKEQKKLLLAPRENPLSAIALENMLKLSRLGVTIAPPMLGFYSDAKSVEDMENFLIGRWLDMLGIENSLYRRWSDDA